VYIKITVVLKQYYMYSTSVCSWVCLYVRVSGVCVCVSVCVCVCVCVCLCAITMVISEKYYPQRILAAVRRNYVLQVLLLTVSTCYTFLLLTLPFHLYPLK
jgi:ABC-type sulfate transport system permease component